MGKKDGLVVIRKLIRGSSLLGALKKAALKSAKEPHYHVALRNGGIRALAFHGLLGGIAASVLDTEVVRLQNSAIWIKDGFKTSSDEQSGPWHKDLHNRKSNSLPMVRAWLALTNAPGAIEWMAGSHRIPHNCPYGHPQELSLAVDKECLHAAWKSKTAEGLLETRLYNLSSGDAVIFDGGLWHRGHNGPEQRIAVDFSFVPGDQLFAGALAVDFFYRAIYHSSLPNLCQPVRGPLFPVVYPDGKLLADDSQWPFIPSMLDVELGGTQLSYADIRWRHHAYKVPSCGINGSVKFSDEL